MCSLVEIKTPDEIYIHYTGRDLGKESTSDRGDSIDSGDTVTINNCTVTAQTAVCSNDMAVQVNLNHDKDKLIVGKERIQKKSNKATETKGKPFYLICKNDLTLINLWAVNLCAVSQWVFQTD